jgi:hypothetical protein
VVPRESTRLDILQSVNGGGRGQLGVAAAEQRIAVLLCENACEPEGYAGVLFVGARRVRDCKEVERETRMARNEQREVDRSVKGQGGQRGSGGELLGDFAGGGRRRREDARLEEERLAGNLAGDGRVEGNSGRIRGGRGDRRRLHQCAWR